MFFLEEMGYTEQEALSWVQETYEAPHQSTLRDKIIDPIFTVLETSNGRREYCRFGSEFLEANMEMLSKEFPTKAVSFPRTYVDSVFHLFGFEKDQFKEILKEELKQVSEKTTFMTLMATPTNFIHAIVLYYSDMAYQRELRDSARHQLGLTVYNSAFNHYFPPPHPNEAIMGYTYNNLDNSWGLVKSENVINWIGNTTETAYAFYKTKMSVNMSINVLVNFLTRMNTAFRQNIRLLANHYFEDMNEQNMIGADAGADDEYIETKSTSKIVDNLIRKIKSGDELYRDMNPTYQGIARLKNVRTDSVYKLAQRMDYPDIRNIMDVILYVFLTKEEHTIEDINSTKFMARITNLPTAVDRAIVGKPIIKPLAEKYDEDPEIVKAYICFVATYIMSRINDI